LVSLILLALVLRAFDLEQFGRALQTASYLYLLPVVALIFLSYAVRALRWRTLFRTDRALPWSSLFAAMMIGYLFNNILPARAGEMIRAYTLAQREGLAKSTIFATVIVERVVDLVIALLLLSVVLLFYPLPAMLGRAGLVVAAISATLITGLVLVDLLGMRLIRVFVRWFGFLPQSLLNRLEAIGSGFVAGVAALRSPWHVMRFLGYSALIWIAEVSIALLMARALHLPISIGGSLFVILVIGLSTMVPSAPGYIGTYEFSAMTALASLKVNGSSALSFALMMHAVTFILTSLIGASCLAFQKFGTMQLVKQTSNPE
jgi:uncharacterized protein (TIRG00374 family)